MDKSVVDFFGITPYCKVSQLIGENIMNKINDTIVEGLVAKVQKLGDCDAATALDYLESYSIALGQDFAVKAIQSYRVRHSEVIFVDQDLAAALSRGANLGRIKSCKYVGGHWHVKV